MEVAILSTGGPPPGLEPRFGDYGAMFGRLLGPGFEPRVYAAADGELPSGPDAHPAYLITGSAAGVYEPLPWIAPLLGFLREAKGRSKLVGICFGHQAMAEALGGRVEKSERGWGIGLQDYDLWEEASWMGRSRPRRIAVPVSHQDQVVVPPPAARVLAGNAFTPFGMLEWESGDCISMQFHPEFEPEYAKALIEHRRGRVPDPDAAIESLERPNDQALVAGWIRSFLLT
jgi:GMP synthase-like glutamine amidotransferase